MREVIFLPNGKRFKTKWVLFNEQRHSSIINGILGNETLILDDNVNLTLVNSELIKQSIIKINLSKRFTYLF